ncbi:MAG: hypothetical protein KFH98_12790 [Gemmatimonadetes bacterium]|nr:hypothetical protein [Gemmatimonadota bacterium]
MHITRHTALIAALSLAGLTACSDPVDPPQPAEVTAASAIAQNVALGTSAPEPPAVRVTTSAGRPIEGVSVQFTVQAGGGTLTGADPLTDADGLARTGEWLLGTAPGRNTVRATVDGLPGAEVIFEATALPPDCSALVGLDLGLGEFVRLKSSAATSYPCLLFDAATSAGNEYVLLFENMALTGGFSTALFPGLLDVHLPFSLTLSVEPLSATAGVAADRSSEILVIPDPILHDDAEAYSWDFGAGRIREHTPEPLDGPPAEPMLLRGGRSIVLGSPAASPVTGDTIQVLMEGIPRLGITTGTQQAVIRHVSDHLIIAEDVRLATTLMREGGGYNTPLTDAELAAIAAQYDAAARVQGDIFFESRYNLSVESSVPHRVTAVHSIMPADDVWGYTYSVTNYFVWDYWVATDGSTKGLNQHPQRVADNLFMHEIAHMRHLGMLQRNGMNVASRGHRWLVEGFARFSERLPISARLLGTTMPSRTGNVVLPRNPDFGNAYFLDDVPTYLHAGSSIYFGYHTSSYLFDYLADQVAVDGGDWLAALREFLLAGASRTELNAVVERWMPGNNLADLMSRARIALYTDDIGTPGLPAWTQYHQFRLRESRPAPERLAGEDPRMQWTRVSPSVAATVEGSVGPGAAVGFIFDGTAAGSGVIRVSAPTGTHANLSLARIR